MNSLLKEVKIINFPKILDDRGNLSFFENSNQIPFDIKRVYWIYDVPGVYSDAYLIQEDSSTRYGWFIQ